jgi:hypothetical protein
MRIYGPEVKTVYERTFAEYDLLFAKEKWEALEKSRHPTLVENHWEYYDITEHWVFKPLLVAEWVVIFLTAGSLYVVLTRRLHFSPEPHKENASASRPTDGPRKDESPADAK